MSLPIVLRRMISLNALGELYNIFLGFGITMVVENLKYKGQKPKLKHEMLTKFFKHVLFLRICLRWLHKSLSGPGIEELLHLAIVIINSSSENQFQGEKGKDVSSLRTLLSMLWCWAVLKELCSMCYRLLISKHGWLLYLIVLIAGNFCLLTQFINS